MDALENFVGGELAATINAAATSCTLATGQGARFPAGSAAYNVTLWNSGSYFSAINAFWAGAAEIVRVTNRSGDTLTIVRAQEGTTARDFTGAAMVSIVCALTTKTLITDVALSLPTGGPGSPENQIDGNEHRTYFDTTEVRYWRKTTAAGTLTGWV